MSAYKIANFTSSEHLVKTTLSNFPRNESLESFSICYWAASGSIAMTGGYDEDLRVYLTKTYLMDVRTDRWRQESFPALNVARAEHSSMALGDQAYVTCGRGIGRVQLASMEMLRLGAQAWELIDIPDFTPRRLPIFSQIDVSNIVILGGLNSKG